MPKKKQITRRDLFKLGLSAGAAATFASTPFAAKSVRAQEDAPKKMSDATLPQVPRRVLGKTGETVPILLMGAAMKFDPKFDPKLAEAFRFGVNYIDAAPQRDSVTVPPHFQPADLPEAGENRGRYHSPGSRRRR